MARPQPEDYETRQQYRWQLKLWRRRHGGSLVAVLAIAFIFGALTGSATFMWLLVAFAFGGWAYMRTRP
jgi:hypothetical protein